jgi:hypothetical protein
MPMTAPEDKEPDSPKSSSTDFYTPPESISSAYSSQGDGAKAASPPSTTSSTPIANNDAFTVEPRRSSPSSGNTSASQGFPESHPLPSSNTTPLPSQITVNLTVRAPTAFGDTILVVGNIAQLGNWNPHAGFRLSSSAYTADNPVWSGTFTLPSNHNLSYKFVNLKQDGSVVWSSGSNRFLTMRSCKADTDGIKAVDATWHTTGNITEKRCEETTLSTRKPPATSGAAAISVPTPSSVAARRPKSMAANKAAVAVKQSFPASVPSPGQIECGQVLRGRIGPALPRKSHLASDQLTEALVVVVKLNNDGQHAVVCQLGRLKPANAAAEVSSDELHKRISSRDPPNFIPLLKAHDPVEYYTTVLRLEEGAHMTLVRNLFVHIVAFYETKVSDLSKLPDSSDYNDRRLNAPSRRVLRSAWEDFLVANAKTVLAEKGGGIGALRER